MSVICQAPGQAIAEATAVNKRGGLHTDGTTDTGHSDKCWSLDRETQWGLGSVFQWNRRVWGIREVLPEPEGFTRLRQRIRSGGASTERGFPGPGSGSRLSCCPGHDFCLE